MAAGFALPAEQRRADGLTKARRRIGELERNIGQQQVNFFQEALLYVRAVNSRKTHLAVQRLRSHSKMTAHVPQGSPGIEQMCRLAGVSRAGYYRQWRQSAPRQEETGLRDVIQRLALANRHYGYRRIGALLGREGWQVNHKRVLRCRTLPEAWN
ncbi:MULTISPECIES: IS3 family transposase [unclassified Mesorhizobium]|uniref:IS3 family transposase n=1 Tax=unclassified Mesorhizobium TaxID=325217 RepID=UPI001FD9F9CD|nr:MULTISPECIES: IS3 family transposase [unclassified Mesorhizobium]WJI81077.1 IS3 family transposase [Mesorhizobium sp. C374B]WJI87618.1 IS3 family transposase [Mesorhizobium sp. C372A]